MGGSKLNKKTDSGKSSQRLLASKLPSITCSNANTNTKNGIKTESENVKNLVEPTMELLDDQKLLPSQRILNSALDRNKSSSVNNMLTGSKRKSTRTSTKGILGSSSDGNSPQVEDHGSIDFESLKNSCMFLSSKMKCLQTEKINKPIGSKTSLWQNRYIDEMKEGSKNRLKRIIGWCFKGRLEQIEFKYGHGPPLYFDLIRFLFFINLVMLSIFVFFVGMPSLSMKDASKGRPVVSPNSTTTDEKIFNCCDSHFHSNHSYIKQLSKSKFVLPVLSRENDTCIDDKKESTTVTTKADSKMGATEHVTSFFIGSEPYSEYLMFYGYFTPDIINLVHTFYHMSYAYMYSWIFCNLISMILLISYYEPRLVEALNSSSKLLGSWNFGEWNYRKVKLMKNKIGCTLKANINEMNIEKIRKKEDPDGSRRKRIRIAVWICVTTMYIGSCVAIFCSKFLSMKVGSLTQATSIAEMFQKKSTIITACGLRTLLTPVIKFLIKFERYNNTWKVTIYIIRLFVLKMLVISTVFINVYTSDFKCNECWENTLASEVWSTVIIDTALYILYIIVSLIRSISQNKAPKFDLPTLLLDLVVDQMTVWVGMLYAPVVILAFLMKLLFMFFLDQVVLSRLKSNSHIKYDTDYLYRNVLLILQLSYVVALLISCYGIVRMIASCCGPFGVEFCKNRLASFSIISASFSDLPEIVQTVLELTQSPPFVFLCTSCLCFFCFYFRSNYKICKIDVEHQKKQLQMALQDKSYLLKKLKMTEKMASKVAPLSVGLELRDKNARGVNSFSHSKRATTKSILIMEGTKL